MYVHVRVLTYCSVAIPVVNEIYYCVPKRDHCTITYIKLAIQLFILWMHLHLMSIPIGEDLKYCNSSIYGVCVHVCMRVYVCVCARARVCVCVYVCTRMLFIYV